MAQVNLEDYLSSVFQNGVLASVHIRRKTWNQLLTATDYKLDKLPENQKAGHRILLEGDTVDAIASMEASTRHWLKTQSLKFPIELIRFVPRSRLGTLLDEFAARREKYKQLVQTLIEQYPQLKEAAREKYPDQWHRMADAYPSVAAIEAAHDMRLETFEYAFPRAFEKTDAVTTTNRLVADQAYRSQQQDMIAQQREQTRQTMIRFLDDTVRDLRGRVVERFQEVITNARNGVPATTRTVNSLRELLRSVREMDFIGDREFNDQLTEVDRQLATSNTQVFKDSKAAMDALDAAMSGVVEYAAKTTDQAVQSLSASFLSGKRRLNL